MTRTAIIGLVLLDATLATLAAIYAAPIVIGYCIHIITTALNGGTP